MAKSTAEKIEYNSNPFTLTFTSFGKLLAANVWWVVVLAGIELLYWFSQAVSAFIDTIFRNPQYTSYGADYTATAVSSSSLNYPEAVAMVLFGFAFALFILAFLVLASVVAMYINGAYAFVALQSQKGISVSFIEAVRAVSSRFWRLLWATVLATLKIIGGLFLFIIPGIRAALRYSQLTYVIMAEPASQKGATKAHDRTKQLTKGRLMEVFGIETIASFVPVLGSTLRYAGQSALYTQLAHYTDKKLEKPKVHWLNYLGLILLAIFTLLIGSVALLVMVLTSL